jgi:hypothetical protein
MRAGLGVLGWHPDAFWNATPIEIRRAVEGYGMTQGTDPDSGAQMNSGYMTPEEYADLKAACLATQAESERRLAEREGAANGDSR